MHAHYADILSRIAEPPQWWDENAVPRYDAFAPDECADLYVDEVALVEIACQACGVRFQVAFSYGFMGKVKKEASIAARILDGTLHWGDPPNVQCCPAGPTMNCVDLRVVEYWKRDSFDWDRLPAFELTLPEGFEV